MCFSLPCLLPQTPARLRCLAYDPLDVRRAAWYADMAAFRGAARDREALLASVLAGAAAGAGCLAARLDVIAGFAAIATRDGLRCGRQGLWLCRAGSTCRVPTGLLAAVA